MALDKMNEALEASLSGEAPPAAVEAPEPVEATPQETEGVEPSEGAEAPKGTPEAPEEPAQPAAERARAPDGKFTKGQPAAAPKPGVKPATAPQQPQAVQAPRTWGALAREQWAALPREVKDQILKRDGEQARFRQEAEPVLLQHRQLQEVLQPFMPHLQAAGVHPVQHIQTMFRTDYALRSSPEPQKAGLFASLMETYGLSVAALDLELERRAKGGQGAPPQSMPTQPQQAPRDPRLDMMLAAQERRIQAGIRQEIEDFASKPEAEFFEQVQDTMADIYAAYERSAARAKASGQQPSPRPPIAEVYRQALTFPQHGEIMRVLAGRKAKAAQQAQAQKVQQARHAAGSVQTEPSSPAAGKRTGLNGMWDALQQNLGGG